MKRKKYNLREETALGNPPPITVDQLGAGPVEDIEGRSSLGNVYNWSDAK